MADNTPAKPGGKRRRAGPRLDITRNEGEPYNVRPECVYAMLDSLGTASPDFMQLMLAQLGMHATETERTEDGELEHTVNEQRLQGMLAMAQGVQPQDEVEAALAAQMAACHDIAMEQARRAANTRHPEAFELHEKAMTKAMRTFSQQMEALTRYRTKGNKTVQHVHVSHGSQAVVGDVHAPASKKAQ